MDISTEVIEVIGEDEVVGVEPAREDHDHRRVVTVDNKDSGDTIRLRVLVAVTVGVIIERVYAEFRLTRQPDDRLTCRGNGEDVFQYADRTLAEYLDEGHCRDLHWSFVGDTGGA
jgi:hypothetical protein